MNGVAERGEIRVKSSGETSEERLLMAAPRVVRENESSLSPHSLRFLIALKAIEFFHIVLSRPVTFDPIYSLQ